MEAKFIHDSDTELNHARRAEQEAADVGGEFFTRGAEAMFAPRENVLDAIQRAAPAQRAGMLLHLQMTRGNQFVQQLPRQARQSARRAQPVETLAEAQQDANSSTTAFSFAVTIPHSQHLAARDAGWETTELDAREMDDQEFYVPPEGLIEPEVGTSVTLPDIIPAETSGLKATDAVAGTLTYEPAIHRGGISLPADDFGVTGFYKPRVLNVAVGRSDNAYQVSATIRNTIRWEVRADRGPDNQSNVESDTSAAITLENYADIARDLTPNMADLGGRPRRAGYWARDLSARHELFHVDQYERHAREGALLARNWLNAQVVSNIAEVHELLARVPERITTIVKATMAFPGREQRAYDDGAELYRERANSIRSKGDNGEYA